MAPPVGNPRRFEHRFQVDAPIAVVAAFHAGTEALKTLTPSPVQLHRIEPLAEGSIAEFTLWLGPIPLRWTARHQDVQPGAGFVDVQEQGPFQFWRHQHSFRPLGPQRSEVLDQIEASFGSGLWNGLISRLLWLTLPILFAYRAWATRRALTG